MKEDDSCRLEIGGNHVDYWKKPPVQPGGNTDPLCLGSVRTGASIEPGESTVSRRRPGLRLRRPWSGIVVRPAILPRLPVLLRPALLRPTVLWPALLRISRVSLPQLSPRVRLPIRKEIGAPSAGYRRPWSTR